MVKSLAVVFDQPRQLAMRELVLAPPGASDVVVRIDWSSISAGTERLLWEGRMPMFPGLGYPLVPGYESVGTVTEAGPDAALAVGTSVFVPRKRPRSSCARALLRGGHAPRCPRSPGR